MELPIKYQHTSAGVAVLDLSVTPSSSFDNPFHPNEESHTHNENTFLFPPFDESDTDVSAFLHERYPLWRFKPLIEPRNLAGHMMIVFEGRLDYVLYFVASNTAYYSRFLPVNAANTVFLVPELSHISETYHCLAANVGDFSPNSMVVYSYDLETTIQFPISGWDVTIFPSMKITSRFNPVNPVEVLEDGSTDPVFTCSTYFGDAEGKTIWNPLGDYHVDLMKDVLSDMCYDPEILCQALSGIGILIYDHASQDVGTFVKTENGFVFCFRSPEWYFSDSCLRLGFVADGALPEVSPNVRLSNHSQPIDLNGFSRGNKWCVRVPGDLLLNIPKDHFSILRYSTTPFVFGPRAVEHHENLVIVPVEDRGSSFCVYVRETPVTVSWQNGGTISTVHIIPVPRRDWYREVAVVGLKDESMTGSFARYTNILLRLPEEIQHVVDTYSLKLNGLPIPTHRNLIVARRIHRVDVTIPYMVKCFIAKVSGVKVAVSDGRLSSCVVFFHDNIPMIDWKYVGHLFPNPPELNTFAVSGIFRQVKPNKKSPFCVSFMSGFGKNLGAFPPVWTQWTYFEIPDYYYRGNIVSIAYDDANMMNKIKTGCMDWEYEFVPNRKNLSILPVLWNNPFFDVQD